MARKRMMSFGRQGFTLIEIIASLVIMGLIALFGTSMLTNAVQGYTAARNADEVAQKAQMALQRMTIEFSTIAPSQTTGAATTITYVARFNDTNETHVISQSGNQILYTQDGTAYPLLDGVAPGSLQFRYYTSYSTTAATSSSAATNIIGITFNMVGDDSSVGMSQTYSTRVKIDKTQ